MVGVLVMVVLLGVCTAGVTAPVVRVETLPRVIYAADDGAAPRWRFLAVGINDGTGTVTVERVTLTLRGPAGEIVHTQAGGKLRWVVQGGRSIPAHGVAVLDLQDDGRGAPPDEARLEVQLKGADGQPLVVSRVVPLVHRPTRYLRFPLAGPWATANGRTVMHGLGRMFALDFVSPSDWPLHERERRGPFTCADFKSYGRAIFSPADGVVVDCENSRPDEKPTPGKASYGSKPVDGSYRAHVGNFIALQLDSGEYLWLAHCRPGSLRVKTGDRVRAGQRLAEVGNSGNTSGPHLHIELVDASPDLARLAGLDQPASGLPLGFKDVTIERAGGRRASGDLVPAFRDVVSTQAR